MKNTTTTTRPFRVVIVGGGLLGLTAAHIFAKTDIDFVVLEQHDNLMPELGSLLLLIPSTFRILDQLGILDAIEPALMRNDRGVFMSATDGTVWKDEEVHHIVAANHGHGVRVSHRPRYVEALYNSLPAAAKAKTHVRKQVVRVEVNDDGVAVHCADGTVERGDMVLGADGVHSRTRQAMQSLAAGLPSDTPQPSPYTTTYRAMFGNLPVIPDLPPAVSYEGAAAGVSTQILTGSQCSWFILYEKLDTPTKERMRWTDADKAAMLERWGHLHMAPGYTLQRAYECRQAPVGLISLEEGLLDKWSWKRMVLVGDAVRKIVPHTGLGYNTGVMDLVELANRLRRLTLAKTTATTTADLETLFADYQIARMRDTPTVMDISQQRARMCAWLSPWHWFMARVLMPWLPLATYTIQYVLGPIIARSPVLEWLDEKNLPAGAMPYIHYPRTEAEAKEEKSEEGRRRNNGNVLADPSSRSQLLARTFSSLRRWRRLD
ncbi:FAD/NAD(P)-binding domain-containing protein [Nemania sp. FL0916]|nr:FAD/NAD(P)-binding domain-containing protein [Nemania sp. FL0916]